MNKDDSTRKKILITAADIFASHGIEGARMDQIAKQAGVNKATIYYNIGNKQALYEEVLNVTFKTGFHNFIKTIEKIKSPEEKLTAYIQNIAKTMESNPHIPILIMREQVSKGRNLTDSVIKNIVGILNTLDSILKQGQENGVFIETDTLTIHFMILSTLMFFITTAPIREKKKAFTGKFQPKNEELLADVAENITNYILKAVRKED
ncbi:MAG: TetR/AcrR family transcriptional regulator [Desulfobacteraceae bacterium]|nr:TetR/AcrR family transcriptional regulator [Desulfobacteraceae bacterium]